jgi:hypothetical protein
MKKSISFTLLATLLFSMASGQVIDELPTDENGKINFNEVIAIDSVTAGEFYLRAKRFFVDTFKSANDVIQMDDKESSIIIGKGYSDIYIKIAGPPTALQMWYSIRIQGRDGRYKYEIYDITFKSYSSLYAPGSTAPAEQAFEKSAYYKNNGEPRAVSERYKIEMLKAIQNLTNSIKTAMKVPTTTKSKNDW